MKLRKMNKNGVSIKQSLFAVLAFSLIIIAVGVIMGDWNKQYSSGIDYDLAEYNQLDDVSSEVQTQRDSITPRDVETGTSDFEGGLFRGSYGILGKVFSSLGGTFNMLDSIQKRFGIPSYVAQGILAFMFIALIFGILAIIFRLAKEP